MWKDYSSGYIKNNRSSSLSVMISAFISALLLSLLCGMFYNLWKYEVERVELEEGSWQSRFTGKLNEGDLESIKNFSGVKEAVINQGESEEPQIVIDVYFNDYRSVLEDSPQIAETVGVSTENITYNHELLALYMIRDPQDTAPRMVFPIFMLVTILAAVSLIVVIHNAFAVTMNARVHQFGIFASIGATPKQIRTCLIQEAAALCVIPLLTGNVLGIICSMCVLKMTNILLGNSIPGRHEAVFGYHPFIFALTIVITVLTIWVSAWLPARKISKMTPLEAIKNTGELQLKRKRNSSVLTFLFGAEGELAGNALKAQHKALRTASLSLIFSFMAFTMMQCFFTLSKISTQETYFERYKDVWDVMVTVKDAEVDSFNETERIQKLAGVENVIVYQKAMAETTISEDEISREMKSLGGFSQASGDYAVQTENGWKVTATIVILDDAGFLAYCGQTGTEPRLDGVIIRNLIRDVTDPDFRHPVYMPYIKGESAVRTLNRSGEESESVEVPVLAYTDQVPVLREAYADSNYYELVHFIPVSLWKEIKGQIAGGEEDMYICVLGKENVSLEELNELQKNIGEIISEDYIVESENRIQEKEINDRQIRGMMIIFGGFCVLLAIIGIGNVFSNTLGFVRQRKREFARYISIGLTPKEMKKMFWIEGLVLAGRPIVFTIPLAFIIVGYMLKASYLEAELFLSQAPVIPVAVFMLSILGAVVLAYYLGWRKVREINLAEVLRDDTLI